MCILRVLKSGSHLPPHDRPCRRTPCGFFKPGFAERRCQTRPHENVGSSRAHFRFNRVAFDYARALLAGILGRGIQQLGREPTLTEWFRHEETHHRPHWLLIHRFQNSGVRKNTVGFTRRERAPCHRLSMSVSQEPGRWAQLDDPFHRPPIARALVLLEVGAHESGPHAPAAAARAAFAEKSFEIFPAIRCERLKFQSG